MDRSFSLEAHEVSCPGCEKHASELQKMKKKMAELKKTIEVMERTSTAKNARIQSHLEGIRSHLVSPKLEFPLKTEEEMGQINNKIRETPSNYIEAFKKMVGPEGLEKNIERFFFAKDLIMKMNYAGGPDKIGLSAYPHLNDALIESSRSEGRSFGDYMKNVREAFAKAKQRVYKATSKAKKMKTSE